MVSADDIFDCIVGLGLLQGISVLLPFIALEKLDKNPLVGRVFARVEHKEISN